MKHKILSLISILGILISSVGYAQFDTNTSSDIPQITPQIKDGFPPAALQNILNAELAFCYTVSPIPAKQKADYKGYTLNGFAITGFCGVLPKQEMDIFIDGFLIDEESISNVVEKCVISPRIMLRFIRGVDYADVLYSSPCHSFTLFYGGKIKSYNVSPVSEMLDDIINAYEKQKSNFVSPALIGQVLPIGIPQSEEQKAILRKQSTQMPAKKWDTPKPAAPAADEPPTRKGWNQLKKN